MSRLRRLVLDGDAGRRGEAHGAAFRDEIRAYADERVELASNGTWAGRPATRANVLDLADATLAAHRAYDADLCDEMEAVASTCGLTPAEMVIAGGFTDFVDLVRVHVGAAPEEDDCTAVIVPDDAAGGAGFLAQTWDMHDSATEHVVMLEVRPEHGPAALVFSTVGCLGQIGMNEAGIAIGINNLTGHGKPGVTWPFVVRKALRQTNLDDALACVIDADLAGAHNYLLFDRYGRGFNVEAMPDCHFVEELAGTPLAHTNHCIAPKTRMHEAKKAAGLLDSSRDRLARAHELLKARPLTLEGLIAMTRDPRVCQRAKPPYHIESSGAAIMRPATGDFWAVWGIPAEQEFEHLAFEE